MAPAWYGSVMAALGQFYVSSMAALGQFYVSSMSVLCQFYVSSMAALGQFYVSSMSVVMPHASPPSEAPGRDFHKHFSLAPARSDTNPANHPQSAPAPSPLQDRTQARYATSRATHLSLIPLSNPPLPASLVGARDRDSF